jgi:cytochrome c oxidase cbb3-type subunit 3
VADLEALTAQRGAMVAEVAQTPLHDVPANAALFDFTLAYGKAAFGDNCAPCHGSGGGGATGYPNLIDDDWLWGGTIDAIQQTITYGVRNENPDSRLSEMPAFGRDGILTTAQIHTVAYYVRSLSGLEVPASADLAAGAILFADNCAPCHGDTGEGNHEFGAPDLTDTIWLYGSNLDTIIASIANSRRGSMPVWGTRLDATTVKALAVYVHSLGGGE